MVRYITSTFFWSFFSFCGRGAALNQVCQWDFKILTSVILSWRSFQVAMLDMHSLSVTFHKNFMDGRNSPVVCIHVHVIPQYSVPANSPKQVSLERPTDPAEVVLILTKDAHVIIIDSKTGDMISRQVHPKDSLAISMYVIGK